MTTSQVCQQVTQAISKVMQNQEIVVTEAKEKIDIIARSCQILPPITEIPSQTQEVVSHSEKFPSDNMAMKMVDKYCDHESCKLNLIIHTAPESQAAQKSESLKFFKNIAKDIAVRECDIDNSVHLGSKMQENL